MRHKWTEVDKFVDRCSCGAWRFRAATGERRFPQYAHTRDGERLDNAPECDGERTTSDKQQTFKW